jgi:hypothetical protein
MSGSTRLTTLRGIECKLKSPKPKLLVLTSVELKVTQIPALRILKDQGTILFLTTCN